MKIGKSTQDTISSIAMIVGTWLLLAGAGYLLRLLLLYFFVIFAFAVTIVMLLLYIILAMMMMPMDDGFWQWPLEMWSEMTPMTAWYIWLLLSGIVAFALIIWTVSEESGKHDKKIHFEYGNESYPEESEIPMPSAMFEYEHFTSPMMKNHGKVTQQEIGHYYELDQFKCDEFKNVSQMTNDYYKYLKCGLLETKDSEIVNYIRRKQRQSFNEVWKQYEKKEKTKEEAENELKCLVEKCLKQGRLSQNTILRILGRPDVNHLLDV